MTVRDLGYRPYEGERLPPSHNYAVMFRHGMGRAWASWFVKIAVFLCWIPLVVGGIWLALQYAATQQGGAPPDALVGSEIIARVLFWEMVIFVSMATLGAGAGAIAEDRQFNAFPFYFSKPVTAPQYLAGRVAAITFWVFVLLFVPTAIFVAITVGVVPEEYRLEQAGLILPTLLQSLLIAVVTGATSVGVSSLSKSRALTMTAWLVLFTMPWAVAFLIEAITEWPWLRLLALPAALDVVGDALYKWEPKNDLRWYHAVPTLAVFTVGALALAYRRLVKAEVIT